MQITEIELILQKIEDKFKPLAESVERILDLIKDKDQKIIDLQVKCADLDKKICLLEQTVIHNNSRVNKLEEIFNAFKKEIREQIENVIETINKKKITPRLIFVTLLASPALTLLLNLLIEGLKNIKP